MKIKIIAIVIICTIVLIAFMGIREAIKTRQAHQTFNNYYAFRGCVQLVKRTNEYGLCKLPSGQTIKLVRFRGKWYLDVDLPFCISSLCF